MIKKAIILACMSVLLFFGIGIRVNAERLFILENVVLNGNFETDSNGDGLANDFTGTKLENYLIDDNGQYFKARSDYGEHYIQQSKFSGLGNNHYYYFSAELKDLNTFGIFQVYQKGLNGNYYEILQGNNYINQSGRYSYIGLSVDDNITSPTYFIRYAMTNNLGSLNFSGSNEFAQIDNFIFIDLTSLFGYGFEPSLSDFELYYLPNLNYFETYNSFEPDLYTQLNESSYPDLGTTLTGIDYTKSIIDTNGKNVDLELSAYFYDVYVNDVLVSGVYTALDYVNDNHPVMYYNGETIELNWVISDYSQRVITLDMTDEQKTILKTILFNRNINRSQEFFYIKVESGFLGEAKFWFSLSSKFDLLVNAKSFLISRKTDTMNDFNIMNEMYIKTYDQYGDVILPALKFNIGSTVKTSYVDNYGSMYSDISRFNFEFLLNSPSNDDTYNYELLFFYELGLFSANEVIQPPIIDSEIEFLWDMKVCDFYQIGCHLGNFANETVSTIYTKMKIDEIRSFFDEIIDDTTQAVSLLPDALIAIFSTLFVGVGVAIIIVIIERANK